MKRRFYRADRTVENVGDLLVGQVQRDRQAEHLPLVRLEALGQGVQALDPYLVGEQLCFGIVGRIRIDDFFVRISHVLGQHPVGDLTPVFQVVIGNVEGNSIDPGEKGAFSSKGFVGAKSAEKGLLGYVLGVVRIAGKRQGQPVDLRLVVAVQLVENTLLLGNHGRHLFQLRACSQSIPMISSAPDTFAKTAPKAAIYEP